MKTLLSDRFAPTTSSIGFLRRHLDDTAAALTAWRRSLVPAGAECEELGSGFPACLRALGPLTGGARPRELLVEASDGWTAYFDCSLRGTDAVSTIGYLSRELGCQGLAITTVPHTAGLPGVEHGQMGSVQFELFGPLQTEFLNYVRTISVSYDSGRWAFEAHGTEQWFEELETYKARKVRDRFTTDMLERYCQALDLDVFSTAAYGPRAALVRSQIEVPTDGYVMTLDEVQQWLEIVPGQVDGLAG